MFIKIDQTSISRQYRQHLYETAKYFFIFSFYYFSAEIKTSSTLKRKLEILHILM